MPRIKVQYTPMDASTRLSDSARNSLVALVDELHILNLPHLAGIIYPVTHPEFPSSDDCALTRLGTLCMLLKSQPKTFKLIEHLVSAANSQLTNQSQRRAA
jgi:hypothetical protein